MKNPQVLKARYQSLSQLEQLKKDIENHNTLFNKKETLDRVNEAIKRSKDALNG